MKAVIASLLLSVVFCSGLAVEPQLTVEQAKDALLHFIRGNRTVFIGDPDPDKLAAIPVKAMGEGRYSLGAFQMDVTKLSYEAAIGLEGPEPHFYSGAFRYEEGVWKAAAPKLQRFHRLPRKVEEK